MDVMTPAHARWGEFADLLHGEKYCNFQQDDPDDPASITWDCNSNLDFSTEILRNMGFSGDEIAETLKFFIKHGGHCDCEVLFNVDRE